MVFSIFYKKGPRQRSVLNRHRSRANPEDLCIDLSDSSDQSDLSESSDRDPRKPRRGFMAS